MTSNARSIYDKIEELANLIIDMDAKTSNPTKVSEGNPINDDLEERLENIEAALRDLQVRLEEIRGIVERPKPLKRCGAYVYINNRFYECKLNEHPGKDHEIPSINQDGLYSLHWR